MSNPKHVELFSFQTDIAIKYGVHEAVFIAGLSKLIEQNREKCICEDGLWWFPCAVHEWKGKFSFWTARQVDRVIKSCMHQGLVFRRHYDSDEHRRRGWYAIKKGLGYDAGSEG